MSYKKHVWVTQEIIRGAQLNHIESGIYDEEHRAIAAENNLADTIANESTRAMNAEGSLSTRVSNTESAITTLNGSSSVSGSVENKITNYAPTYTKASSMSDLSSGEKLTTALGKISAAVTSIISHVGDTSNPHGVTKSQVGLGSVPNVSTNNQTPTYTEATDLASLTSGEKLSVAFGKIAKAVSSLIEHIGNKSNPHAVTKNQVGLGNVGNYKAVSTVANQGLTETEQANARANIGAGSASGTGTVTSVTAGAGLAGGTISVSGTIKANLKSETLSTLTAASKGSTSSREYAVGLDKNGNLAVNVPWTGTVTKITAGAGLAGGDITTTGTLKVDIKSETKSTLTAATKGSTASREYSVGLDSAGDLSVNIPWTDTRDFKTGTTKAEATDNTLYFVYTT